MMLGATYPHLQGAGIGHALVLARLDAISRAGGGVVLVSAKKPERWLRYGFGALTVNLSTGSTMLSREVAGVQA